MLEKRLLRGCPSPLPEPTTIKWEDIGSIKQVRALEISRSTTARLPPAQMLERLTNSPLADRGPEQQVDTLEADQVEQGGRCAPGRRHPERLLQYT